MRFLPHASLLLAFAAACAPAVAQPTPVAMPAQPPAADEAEPAVDPPPAPEPAPVVREDPSTMLNGAWAATYQHNVKWADARRKMQDARTAYVAAASPMFASDAGVLPAATDFQNVNQLIEQLNRRAASAYYAPDATTEQRIQVLDEISEMLLRWSQKLDEMGLAKTPASFRTNGAIALTFEDVVQGPAKRWRGEGLTLANLCVQRAKAENVTTSAARSCETLHKTYTTAQAAPQSSGQPECACPPGDPLCSASMSGWCKPGAK